MTDLRPHQEHALTMLRYSLASGRRRPMLNLPTGAGKTRIAAEVAHGALGKGNRVLFCVPAIELIDQTIQMFWDEGLTEVGVIQGDHHLTNWSKPIQVASVQTLQRRELPDAQVVMVDEAHRQFRFFDDWMRSDDWRHVPFIGLSATPWTKGLGDRFDDLLIPTTTADLIEQGYLSPFKVFAPSHPNLKGIKVVAGDFQEAQLSERMNQRHLVGDVVQTWIQRGEDRPTLCFAVDRAHARSLHDAFFDEGIPVAYMDANTPGTERRQIREDFESGKIKVVVNIETLILGVDWDVRCLIMARPTRSLMMFHQITGRGLRTAPGKQNCLILDHSDNHLRLGFVTDPVPTTLLAGKARYESRKEEPETVARDCPECAAVFQGTLTCPNCGYEIRPKAKVITVNGELRELDPNTPLVKEKGKYSVHNTGAFYAQLLFIAQEKGWKPGWAANQYRKKLGEWPPYNGIEPQEPASEVRAWVQGQMIRYAKGKAKEKERLRGASPDGPDVTAGR